MGKLQPERAALAVIDMQEGFRAVIPDFDAVAARIAKAVQGAHLLNVPVVVTEQYPRGLKQTAAEIRGCLNGVAVLEKMTFSSCGIEAFGSELRGRQARQVLVCGIEAHICVTQTALDLIEEGYEVHLLVDCITSRDPRSKEIALARLQPAGAIVSCLEMALFELMSTAESPQFKAVQALIR
ncbi:MAG: isochorismatase family protein [Armatimonadetes bacterium]|nr:isochorismatase family protein [Armatimonadota bacterium]